MNIFGKKLLITGYVRISLRPDSHNNASLDRLSFINIPNPTEKIIQADYKYSFRNDTDSKLSESITDFLDDNKSFTYKTDTVMRRGYLFEIIVPKGWCIKNLSVDSSTINFFTLYSETPKGSSLRYNFYLNQAVDFVLTGILVKDVNNIYDQLVRAEFDTKKRNKIIKGTLKKATASNTKQFATKIEEIRSRYGTFLKDVIEGKVKTETDFETELRIILKIPSFKLPSSIKRLFDHNDAPHQTNICEILSQSYIGDFNDISADTFRTVYREKQTKR